MIRTISSLTRLHIQNKDPRKLLTFASLSFILIAFLIVYFPPESASAAQIILSPNQEINLRVFLLIAGVFTAFSISILERILNYAYVNILSKYSYVESASQSALAKMISSEERSDASNHILSQEASNIRINNHVPSKDTNEQLSSLVPYNAPTDLAPGYSHPSSNRDPSLEQEIQGVIGMPGISSTIAELCMMEPRTFDEMPRAIQALRERKAVLLNLTMMQEKDAQRAVDFVAGGTFSIDGTQERVGERIFVFAPSSMTISKIDSDLEKESSDLFSNDQSLHAESSNEVVFLEPSSIEEEAGIVLALEEGKTVLLSFSRMDPEPAKVFVDRISAVVSDIDGHQEKIADNTFLFTPKATTITHGSATNILEASEKIWYKRSALLGDDLDSSNPKHVEEKIDSAQQANSEFD